MARKVLFISHEASRSGAPILLLTWLSWLRKNTRLDFDILLLTDGPLRVEFEKLARTYVADRIVRRSTLINRIRKKVFGFDAAAWLKQVLAAVPCHRYDVVFGNSIVSLPWLVQLRQISKARAICYVHELSWVIERLFTNSYIARNLALTDTVVACSNSVAENLTREFRLDSHKIVVAHGFLDPLPTGKEDKRAMRRRLGIAPGELVIGGVGNPELRKGTDLIVPLAVALRRKYPQLPFRMVWLGGSASNEFASMVRMDARKLGLEEKLIFVEHTDRPDDYINLYDLFILLSREDPFPLVTLAAAHLKKPIIAFEQSGGIDELICDCAVCLVPYLDVERFADAIHALSADPALRTAVGNTLGSKAASEFGAEATSRRLYDVLALP